MERTPEAYTRGILAAVLDPWIDGLHKVSVSYQTDKKLRAQLEDPSVEPGAKAVLVDSLLPTGSPPELSNLLNLLLANSNFGFVDEILNGLSGVVREEAGGPLQAIIISAIELGDDERARVEARLISQFGSNLDFKFRVESDILGGLIVQVGDKLIDDSVRGRIDALRSTLGVRAA
ncbi:MAG: ATP synthase F1 subunit delta [Chloroflexi bacterium]|nr:ATP synthase F1 subunit delta [Chloroflexota bacterium]